MVRRAHVHAPHARTCSKGWGERAQTADVILLVAAGWRVAVATTGYRREARAILGTRIKIEEGIRAMKELRVLGQPASSVVSFDSPVFNIYHVSDAMSARGWNLNTLQFPARYTALLPPSHVAIVASSANVRFAGEEMCDCR